MAKARAVLGSFNAHREVNKVGSRLNFNGFDLAVRDALKTHYGDANKVEYAVGILAELPEDSLMEKLGMKDEAIIGSTLMNAIARHAFRYILSNRYMTREFLNREVLGDFGWTNLHATSTVADLVKRNVAGEMDRSEVDRLRITFEAPK